MLRHLPFHDLLAAHPNRRSPEWTEGTAALLLLRLFDDWIGAPTMGTLRDGGIPQLRHLISKIANPEVRRMLDDALMTLRKVHPSDSSFAVGPLLAYARYLDELDWYPLAADVLTTVLEVLSLRAPTDFRLAATTYERLSYNLIQELQLDEASRTADKMQTFAELASEQSLFFKSDIYRGMIAEHLGRLEEVEVLHHNLIEQTRKLGDRALESNSWRGRASASIAGARYSDALAQLRQAYVLTSDRIQQEWITCDVAACMMGLGRLDIARPIHRHLTRTALRRPTRLLAHVNLLETAVTEGDQVAFAIHWKELNTRKPVYVTMYADFCYAQGIERWQGYARAAPLYAAVAERADSFGARGIARQARAYL